MTMEDDEPTVCRIPWDRLRRVCSGLQAPRVILLGHSIRIDNRAELKRTLMLSHEAHASDVFEAAWARWGKECANHIRGSFAFALIEPVNAQVHLVRDIFGLCPLFYHRAPHTLTIASNSTALRSALKDRPDYNTLMMADFVSNSLIEREDTYFEGVLRVPAAHIVSFSPDNTRKYAYWTLSNIPHNHEPVDAAMTFRQIFDKATANCVVEDKTALMLSGGLDSSAIAAAWRASDRSDAPLPAYALTYRETKGWSDEQHLMAVADRTKVDLVNVSSDAHNPLEDMDFWLESTDGPYLGPGHSVSTRLLKFAREAGYGIVLSGHGGDEIVSYGTGRVNELAMERRWLKVWRETRGLARLYKQNRFLVFARYLSHYKALRPALRLLAKRTAGPKVINMDFLHPHIRDRADESRYQSRRASHWLTHSERMLHEEVLSQPLQPASLEVYSLCSRAVGVETRMPFYDRELLELSVALPSHWKLRDGYSRFILRAAMRDRLPQMVLERGDKYDFGEPFLAGLAANKEQVLDLTASTGPLVSSLVNKKPLDEARAQLNQNGTATSRVDAFFLWRVAILRLWAEVASRKPKEGRVRTIREAV